MLRAQLFMKLEIILQILFTNDMQDVVSKAVQIENNIALPYGPGDELMVQLYKSELPADTQFKGGESYGTVPVKVLAVNVYSISKPYLVSLPNGTTRWVKDEERRSSPAELVSTAPTNTAIAMP